MSGAEEGEMTAAEMTAGEIAPCEVTAEEIAPSDSGRHERERGSRVVTLELSQARIALLVASGLLDDEESDDRTIGAAIKALIDGAVPTEAPVPCDDRELAVPVMLDPDEQAFLLESQLLPVHGSDDRHGMARIFKKLLGEARAHWLQFNAPQRHATPVAVAAAPLDTAELAAIEEWHRAEREAAPPATAPVRVVPREAQKAYLRAWTQTGAWPREWGPLPDEPGTVIVDADVRAVFGLDPIPRHSG